MTSLEKTKQIVNVLEQKKADDIKVLQLNELTILADYFIIASATNTTHVQALCDEVEYQLKQGGIKLKKIEGYQYANWILLDYEDVVLHIFQQDTRKFYSLERLWSDAENICLTDLE